MRELPVSSWTGWALLRSAAVAASIGLFAVALVLPGCGPTEAISERPAAAPGVTYTGLAELRGTIGSMARLEGREPLLVSGYGVVVNLDGTGSGIVPAFLETWLVNEMRKLGVGSRSLAARYPEWERMTPQRVLRDPRTAVVRVSGLIPSGASVGTRFDLLVDALDEDTGTISLAGGQLWQTTLSVFGDNRQLGYTRPLAKGRGPVYISPYQGGRDGDGTDDADRKAYMRRAVIVGGGAATEPRRLEIVLNQPSWARAAVVRDTINERFRTEPDENKVTANAVSDLVIQLSIPRRYRNNPQALLDLIAHTYPYPVPAEAAVDSMVDWMEREPDDAEAHRRAGLVIKALGATAVPALSRHYGHADPQVRLAALEAGAFLRDESTSDQLFELSNHSDPAVRIAVAEALVHLPRSTKGLGTLRKLLSDAEVPVRLAAYETLAVHDDPLIDRLAIVDPDGTKFTIDRVPADDPFIYITAEGAPRIVLFDPHLGFRTPVFASLWNHRLVMQSPQSIPQAKQGLDVGNVAFLPVTHRGPVRHERGVTFAEVYDAQGNTVTVRASNPHAAALLGDSLPETPAPGQHFALQGRVVDELAGQLKVELLDATSGLEDIPLSVYYRSPFDDKPTVHRVSPTVATLAFFLAHHPTLQRPQDGLDLNFGQVVDAIYKLGDRGAITAPVELRLSPLAEMIVDVRTQAAPLDRPETDGNAPGLPETVEPTPEPERVSRAD